jgi:hypothetical protein
MRQALRGNKRSGPVLVKEVWYFSSVAFRTVERNDEFPGFLFGIFFDPENGGDMYLRNGS